MKATGYEREIRGWLLVQPRPVAVRCTREDGDPVTITVQPGQAWAEVAKSIAAVYPTTIEALDGKDVVTRVFRPENDEDDDEEEEGIPVADGESMRLVTFARLLADAYKHSTDVAFERLASLFESVTARSIALERTADNLNRALLKQALDVANGEGAGSSEGSFEQMMMAQFMKGQAAAAAANAAKTNGAPPKKEPE